MRKNPALVEETLKKLGKEFKNAAKKRAKAELKDHQHRTSNEEKNAIAKKWGTKFIGEDVGMTELIYNSAPHFHLVEQGHNLVSKNGRVLGFVPGKHIMQKTKQEYEEIVPERFEQMIETQLERNHLL